MFTREYAGMSDTEVLEQTRILGEKIRLKLNMSAADLDPIQSKFFKDVWVNPPRLEASTREQDTDWDILNV
jgi:hypothetical protein